MTHFRPAGHRMKVDSQLATVSEVVSYWIKVVILWFVVHGCVKAIV
jgi:hypothetical protein